MQETFEGTIWAQLVSVEPEQKLTITPKGRAAISQAVKNAIEGGDLMAVAEGLALVGFLATQDYASDAVAVLAAVLPLPGLETTPLFVDLTTLVTSFGVSGIGFGTPSVLIVPIAANPAFIGLQLHGQAAMLPAPGAYEGSNAILVAIG